MQTGTTSPGSRASVSIKNLSGLHNVDRHLPPLSPVPHPRLSRPFLMVYKPNAHTCSPGARNIQEHQRGGHEGAGSEPTILPPRLADHHRAAGAPSARATFGCAGRRRSQRGRFDASVGEGIHSDESAYGMGDVVVHGFGVGIWLSHYCAGVACQRSIGVMTPGTRFD